MKNALLGMALLLMTACGGGDKPAAAPSTDTTSPAPAATTTSTTSGSPEGGECSDDVAIQKKCAEGLVCGPPKAGAPVSEHTPGVCKKP